MLKRILTATLSAVLALSFVPTAAFATTQGALTTGTSTLATQVQTLKESQTALGLFKYIRDNSKVGSSEYIDAQCAIDILTGTVKAGVDYPEYQGSAQDGSSTATNGASNAKAYKKVNLTDPDDAAALTNFDASLKFIDEYNSYRAKENKSEGTKLSTNVGMNCRMMAISIVQCDWSKATTAHSRAFNVGENLAWGYSRQSPFAGWYTEEKANYKANNGGQTGHYLNIVNKQYNVTGFAVTTSSALYGVCHEQSFSYGTSWEPINVIYTTSEFRTKWLNKYYAKANVKRANTMTAKAKKATVKLKASTLKKSAKTIANLNVKKAKGAVTYKNVSTNKKAKAFKVTSKGKVKVTKGLKKGKYKVIVQVRAKGNADYKSKTVKASFTVRVV